VESAAALRNWSGDAPIRRALRERNTTNIFAILQAVIVGVFVFQLVDTGLTVRRKTWAKKHD